MVPDEKNGETPKANVTEPPTPNGVKVNRVSTNERINLLIGIAGIVISLSLGPDWGGRRTIAIAIAVVLIVGIFRIESWLAQNLKGVVPAIAIVLVGLIPFLVITERKEVPASNNPVQSDVRNVAHDDWAVWEQKVKDGVKNCGENDYACIAKAISQPKYPRSISQNSVDELNADIRAGSFLMNIDRSFNMLDKCTGVKRNFIGDGLSLPHKTKYWERRVQEYLVQNYVEATPALWTWELNLQTAQGPELLASVLKHPPIDAIRGRTNQAAFLKNVEKNVSGSGQAPAVIRFGKFPKGFYRGTLGKPNAKRVFVLRLSDVYNSTLDEAVRLSGHSLDLDPKDPNPPSLWIWVYLPTGEAELVPPTWGQIILNISGWLENDARC